MGGLLVQDRDIDLEDRSEMEVVTERKPSEGEWGEMLFAWKVCKHVRSNAIVLARDLASIGIGSLIAAAIASRDESRGRVLPVVALAAAMTTLAAYSTFQEYATRPALTLAERVAELVGLGDGLISGPKGYEALGAFNPAERSQALDQLGHSRAADARSDAARCPVDGFVVFSDNFHEARTGGVFHQGIDMPAATGTPVVALVGGVLRHDVGGAGGNGAWLAGTDDVSYYYAHFSRYEGDERSVAAGEVIGYVGSTGDATGPHLHFEMHPAGGAAVDPYALLLALCAEETGGDVG